MSEQALGESLQRAERDAALAREAAAYETAAQMVETSTTSNFHQANCIRALIPTDSVATIEEFLSAPNKKVVMSQDALEALVIETLTAWAQEEFEANGPDVSLEQRRQETMETFLADLKDNWHD